jgi:5-methylcytosine-specific restriction endonuclease McrA
MKLTPKHREEVRQMFGGKCAYCGCVLDAKWHVDHVEPVLRDTVFIPGEVTKAGYSKTRATGKLFAPQNENRDNLFPSCVRCNIVKGSSNVEGFRQVLMYFAESIPKIKSYSHVHHLMRFGKISIDPTPVKFWFERYRKETAV